MSSPRRSPMFFTSSPFIGIRDTSRHPELASRDTSVITVFPAFDTSDDETTSLLASSDNDDDVEALPSYGAIGRDLPPNYCTYGICALRRWSCTRANCCIDRELRMGSQRRRSWLGRVGLLCLARTPILCLICAMWSFAILFAMVAIAPLDDTQP